MLKLLNAEDDSMLESKRTDLTSCEEICVLFFHIGY